MTAVEQAIENNISWCGLVCRTHGIPYSETGGIWYSHDIPPRFYPDAITAAPGLAAPLAAGLRGRYGATIKDSYGELSLEGHGYMRLFDAQWIELRMDGISPALPAPGGSEPADASAGAGRWELVARDTAHYGWSHAGGLDGVILPELMDNTDVRIFGYRENSAYTAGFVAFRTGAAAGVSSVFTADGAVVDVWSDMPALVLAEWDVDVLVGYEHVQLQAALSAGFRSLGPVTVWLQDDDA